MRLQVVAIFLVLSLVGSALASPRQRFARRPNEDRRRSAPVRSYLRGQMTSPLRSHVKKIHLEDQLGRAREAVGAATRKVSLAREEVDAMKKKYAAIKPDLSGMQQYRDRLAASMKLAPAKKNFLNAAAMKKNMKRSLEQ